MPEPRKDPYSIDGLRDDRPFRLADFEVDPKSLRIRGPQGEVKVEFKVMEVLLALARSAGVVVSRRDLEASVWSGRVVSEDAVTNAVAKLRKAFNDNARAPRVIETVPKHGYRLLQQPHVPQVSLPSLRWPARGLRWGLALIAVAAMVAVVTITRLSQRPQTPSPIAVAERTTVAVLPFESLSEDHQGLLAAGITQGLIADLSVQPGMRVITAKSTFAFDPDQPGADLVDGLAAHYQVGGTILKRGSDIELDVHLTESSTGKRLWSDHISYPAGNVLEAQNEVARKITAILSDGMDAGLEFVGRRGTTQMLAAYDEFLKGRAYYSRMTPEDNLLAREHFMRAIELDPQFARAHAGLALTWAREVMDGWSADPEYALAEASRQIRLAEAIDTRVPQIYFAKGIVALFRGQHLAAAEAAHRATDLDPNYADAYGLLAWILHYGGRPDVAVRALHEALRLNPLSSASYDEVAGEINFATGRYEQAVRSFRSALTRNPSHARARLWLAASLAQLGEYDDAEWEIEELTASNPSLDFEKLAFGFPHKDPELPRRFFGALSQLFAVKETAAVNHAP